MAARAGGHDLLERRHDKTDGALLTGRLCLPNASHVVTFAQILRQPLVKSLFPCRQRECLRVYLPPHKDGSTLGISDLALGTAEHDAVEQSAMVKDGVRGVKELVVQELNQ